MQTSSFTRALPVWPSGRTEELNLTAGFRAVFTAPDGFGVTLRVACSPVYRVTLDGDFVGYGPARASHGSYRVDEWSLPVSPGQTHVVAVEVAGYNINSYYLLDQPSFIQAELVSGSTILAATGKTGFTAHIPGERRQIVQRYSFQRMFVEDYDIAPDHDAWQIDPDWSGDATECEVVAPQLLLPRNIEYPAFTKRAPARRIANGTVASGELPPAPWRDRSLTKISDKLKGFPMDKLESILSDDVQRIATLTRTDIADPSPNASTIDLPPNAYETVDFGVNLTGFIGVTVTAAQPVTLYLTFDEILVNGEVDFLRMSCVNAVRFNIPSGTFALEAFEPYTLRYAKLIAIGGSCTISDIYLREYAAPNVWEAQFHCSDTRLDRLFEAGRETYRQNALDIFMDCPSRERAGWLCDSFFTSRVSKRLTGDAAVERNFLENFALAASFAGLPDGALPMCYPADHYDGVFIPQWMLWFVLQAEEYVSRSGDVGLLDVVRARIFGMFDYLKPFVNSDGLLESLESWCFIEWSKANEFVQDVNYPTNMLYSAALDAASRMYGRDDCARDAAEIRRAVIAQSFDGEFFVDNALRVDGNLVRTENRSETCQYYAFYFDLVTPTSHKALWNTLVNQFGAKRPADSMPQIHRSNAFMGNLMRLELLARYDLVGKMLDECAEYLLYMAGRTGTLWEHDVEHASCNHGFNSHIVHRLYASVLGVESVDQLERSISISLPDISLTFCEGRIPLPDGFVELSWRRDSGAIKYRLSVPSGYTVTVSGPETAELVRE
ncbi:MAG TPA: hypothetical protein VGK19_03030 [Capsulimonadaceae bacterium]|jgi:alpha-L-rhamnosidase